MLLSKLVFVYNAIILLLIFPFVFLLACTQKTGQESEQPQVANDSSVSEQDLVKRGRSVYMTSCISCHNSDPSKDGSIGPAIIGSSLDLLQTKVLHNSYPPRYSPKRSTSQMVAMPHLEKELPALHAFLNQPDSER